MYKLDISSVPMFFFPSNFYIFNVTTQYVIMVGAIGVKDIQDFFVIFLQLLKSATVSK